MNKYSNWQQIFYFCTTESGVYHHHRVRCTVTVYRLHIRIHCRGNNSIRYSDEYEQARSLARSPIYLVIIIIIIIFCWMFGSFTAQRVTLPGKRTIDKSNNISLAVTNFTGPPEQPWTTTLARWLTVQVKTVADHLN